ncbi:AraC family transcriptional regulator ligand-binding domain-containing protein [Segnochrobactraceae bacterium EtOH-i3]
MQNASPPGTSSPRRRPLPPAITIPVAAVHGILSGVVRRLEPAEVCALVEAAGIAPALLSAPGARVTGQHYVALFRQLIEHTGDDCIGLLSRPVRRGGFVLVARSTLGAASLRGTLKRIGVGFGVLMEEVRFELVEEDGLTGLLLTPQPDRPPPPNFYFELMLRSAWRLLAWLAGGRLPVARIEFCFPRPDYEEIYPAIFSAPLAFDRPAAGLWIETRHLAAPPRREAAALEAFLAATPDNIILPWQDDRSAAVQVRALLRAAAPAWPDLPTIARQLNMSVSTLQRRLSADGQSFQSVKDQLRRDLAITRLSTGAEPLALVAADLGFADGAAFQRAFKSWTGSPPGAYRRQQAGE